MHAKALIIAGAALAAAVATTQPLSAAPTLKSDGRMEPSIMFNLLDRNGDGAIDKDEASALTNAIFAALDADHNGTLSEQELQGALNHMRMGRMGNGHGNANDQFSFRRGPGGQPGNNWRGNRMGPEMMEPQMAERPQIRRGHPGPNGPQGPGPNMGQGPGPSMGQGPGPSMGQGPGPSMGAGPGPNGPQSASPDAGQGSETGLTAQRLRVFDYLDTNGDGVISKDEFAAARSPRLGLGGAR